MFFQIDDQFQTNAKAKALARRARKGDAQGLAAIGLWTLAGSTCQATLTDGVVSEEDVASLTLNPQMGDDLAALLVGAGLWHASQHACERCPDVAAGTWLFHDWFAMSYDTAEQVKTKRAKSKELKDRVLVAQVWARDCISPAKPNTGHCRYCGTTLNKKDTRSDNGPTMDHIDPHRAVGVENVVLSCWPCNRKKGQRTPEAADMQLRPQPTHSRTPARSQDRQQEASPGTPAAETPRTPARSQDRQQEASPGTPAAETPLTEHPRLTSERPSGLANRGGTSAGTSALTTVETSAEAVEIAVQGPVQNVSSGARRGAGAGRAGQGGVTSSTGSPALKPAASKARRRRRGKARSTHGTTDDEPEPAAAGGPAPPVQVAGQFGSPWHSWSGPRSGVEETTCPRHNEEQPCRHCLKESE